MEPTRRRQSLPPHLVLGLGSAIGLVSAAMLWSWSKGTGYMSNSEIRIWLGWSAGVLMVALVAAVVSERDRRDRLSLLAFAGFALGFVAWFLWQVWVALSNSA
jgi:zinc transporter ZupT